MALEFLESPQQQTIREFVHWVAKEKMRPYALEADRNEEVPLWLLTELKETGITMDTGSGGGRLEEGSEKKAGKAPKEVNRLIVTAVEELGWGDAGITLTLPGAGLGGPPVSSFGTPEQRERFFGIFKDKELKWGAYATTEPQCGSDVSDIRTRCVKDGDAYILNGTKTFITNGNIASWVVVFATIDFSLGRAGHRAFVVEKGMPGFVQGEKVHKMGLRANDTAVLYFEDCRVPKENLLGGEDLYEARQSGGFRVAMGTFDATRPIVAAMALGIARAAFEHTRDFIKANYSLDRPIARYRRIKEKLAEMGLKLEHGRLLTQKAAWMADVGRPNTLEASAAKAYMGKAALEVCAECIDLIGDSGTTQDHLLEKWFRDIKVYDIFEGTGQVNRLVVARRLYEPFGVRV